MNLWSLTLWGVSTETSLTLHAPDRTMTREQSRSAIGTKNRHNDLQTHHARCPDHPGNLAGDLERRDHTRPSLPVMRAGRTRKWHGSKNIAAMRARSETDDEIDRQTGRRSDQTVARQRLRQEPRRLTFGERVPEGNSSPSARRLTQEHTLRVPRGRPQCNSQSYRRTPIVPRSGTSLFATSPPARP